MAYSSRIHNKMQWDTQPFAMPIAIAAVYCQEHCAVIANVDAMTSYNLNLWIGLTDCTVGGDGGVKSS
jgi:hypothetical protein